MDIFAARFCLLCRISGSSEGQNTFSVFERDMHKTNIHLMYGPEGNSYSFVLPRALMLAETKSRET